MSESVPAEEDHSETYVTAFSRGLAVIRCFSAENPVLTIAEVAKAAGLNRATARRFLHTLEADGYAGSENGRYSLRPRVLELGYAYLSSISVDRLVHRQLLQLADRLHESCSGGVLDGHDVVFVERAQTSHPRVMTLALHVGTRIPAYLTALGRVLLAELPDERLDDYLRTTELRKETANTVSEPAELRAQILGVRAKGYCIMDQEIEIGIRAAAVPVRRPEGPALAISVASHASRHSLSFIETEFVPPLLETAAGLERLLSLRS
jgi:IclR family transcriptional regulator, pca regulon regulatory protein